MIVQKKLDKSITYLTKSKTLKTIYPNSEIVSSMWFIDPRFKKFLIIIYLKLKIEIFP